MQSPPPTSLCICLYLSPSPSLSDPPPPHTPRSILASPSSSSPAAGSSEQASGPQAVGVEGTESCPPLVVEEVFVVGMVVMEGQGLGEGSRSRVSAAVADFSSGVFVCVGVSCERVCV